MPTALARPVVALGQLFVWAVRVASGRGANDAGARRGRRRRPATCGQLIAHPTGKIEYFGPQSGLIGRPVDAD